MRRVVVLGPVPDSAGGIGVLMGHLSRTDSEVTELEFVDSGGSPGSVPQRLAAHLNALRRCAGPAKPGTVFHLNLASDRSAWRKVRLGRELARRRRPYVVHLHGGGFDEFLDRTEPRKARRIRRLFQEAAAVVVLGQHWRDLVIRDLNVVPDKVHVIPNAVPGPETVPVRSEGPVVLFSGQLGRRKGTVELLRAWREMDPVLRTRLVLAGDLNDPDGSVAEELRRTPDVEVTGWLGPEEITERMAQAGILALPSHAENLPMSLLDGMAWQLAPVVTPVGAVSEVVEHGESGWFVPPGDATALRLALESLMLDAGKCQRIAEAARRRWETGYGITTYRERLDALYTSVSPQ